MTIFRTDRLIENFLKSNQRSFNTQKETLIKPIEGYFPNPDRATIHAELMNHGLFNPFNTKKKVIENWLNQDYWSIVNKLFNRLKKDWSGPDLDLFIFPIDVTNLKLTDLDHRISGLSYSNIIFLFFDDLLTEKSISPALAHEYSHSIRLQEVHNFDQPIHLKDTLILEGIAEVITKRLYGISLLPETTLTSDKLTEALQEWIEPNLEISSNHPLYRHLIYGSDNIPKYLGYYAGTYFVENWQTKCQMDISDLIRIPTEVFFEAN